MSIALGQRIADLEKLVDELAYQLVTIRHAFNKAKTPEEMTAAVAQMNERITQLENRPKPGRPPKNG